MFVDLCRVWGRGGLFRHFTAFVLWSALLVTLICVFVPFAPLMPAESLDPSWVFGMNQGVAQGLVFGRDLIFTFGPYSSIYTKTYHPATDFLMVVSGLYLAVSYWLGVVFLSGRNRRLWAFVFAVVLGSIIYSRDALLFSYPLLVALSVFNLCRASSGLRLSERWELIALVFLFAPFGLLPLVKGSILMLCGAVTFLCFVLLLVNKRPALALVCCAVPLLSVSFFWGAGGQSLIDLPRFFLNMAPIISGYTEAMAIAGDESEIFAYLAASAVLFICCLVSKEFSPKEKFFLFFVFFVYLFISFKGGFVRHDGHAVIASTSIVLAAIFYRLISESKAVFALLIVSAGTWLYIDSHHMKTSGEQVVTNFSSTYSSAWHGLKKRFIAKDWLRGEFDSAVSFLKGKASFPELHGTADIYSFNQSYLIASGLDWSPRPILQSYSVYTPLLAELNKRHLSGVRAPDNIIFKVEPIDGRLPALEDGASWPVLLSKYRPVMMENDFLFLAKADSSEMGQEMPVISDGKYHLGVEVEVPRSSSPIFVEMDIRQSFWGRLVSFLFKPEQLQISLELESGLTKTYRLVSGMAGSGFIISPLVEGSAQFALLYGRSDYLAGQRVRKFVIRPVGGESSLWSSDFSLKFKQVELPSSVDFGFLKFDGAVSVEGYNVVNAERCEGSIDVVNGVSPSVPLSISGLLSVNGWLAVSVDSGALPEAVFLALADDKGQYTFISTRQTLRPDVGAYFKKASLNESGYVSTVDLAAFDGGYTLGLAFKREGRIEICTQFKASIDVKDVPN